MSVNWVMLSDTEGFVRLPGEQKLFTSPPRTSLSLQSMNKTSSRPPFNISCSDGRVFLTTRRVVYLPTHPPATSHAPGSSASSDPSAQPFQSFAVPVTHLHDTHVTAPWFGPNEILAVAQPVPNGGIPPHHAALKLTLTFREGGAYDFHSKFVQVRERLAQALEARGLAGMGGDDTQAGRGAGRDADTMAALSADLHLEDLPAYEESVGHTSVPAPPVPLATRPVTSATAPSRTPQEPPRSYASATASDDLIDMSTEQPPTVAPIVPAEPPPGYEETQRDSVADELHQRLRFSHHEDEE